MVRDATSPEMSGQYVRVAQLADVEDAGCLVVLSRNTLACFPGVNRYGRWTTDAHAGFPEPGPSKRAFSRAIGTMPVSTWPVGGTFDQWADDVPVSRYKSAMGKFGWTRRRARGAVTHQRQRLRDWSEISRL
jgi:hypothetical protein